MLKFNEHIALNEKYDVKKIINPNKNIIPKVLVISKGIKILIEDSLKENTTYNINFKNSIQDITENNKIEDLNYTFSTGKHIDSLSIWGKIISPNTGKGKEDVDVFLYESFEDSIVLRKKPDYITTTDSLGVYFFNYLPKKKFKLFAIEDKNSSKTLDDFKKEKIGFTNKKIEPIFLETYETLDTLKENDKIIAYVPKTNIMLYDSLSVEDIVIFNENEKKLNIIESGIISKYKFFLIVNDKKINFKIKPYTDSVNLFIDKKNITDTIFIWSNVVINNNSYYEVLQDSIIIDTISFIIPKDIESDILKPIYKKTTVSFKKNKKEKTSFLEKKDKEEKKINSYILNYEKINTTDTINIKLSTPINKIIYDSVYFEKIIDTIKVDTILKTAFIDSSILGNFKIKKTIDSLINQKKLINKKDTLYINLKDSSVVFSSDSLMTINDFINNKSFFNKQYKKNKIEHKIPLSSFNISIDKVSKNIITILFDTLSYNSKYRITFKKDAIKDIYNKKNDSIKLNFMTRTKDDYGNLILNIKLNENKTNSFVEIYKFEKEKISIITRKSLINQKSLQTLEFKNLVFGKYKARIIIDKDNNNVWFSGSYFEKKQPEKIIVNENDFEIKKKFTIEQDWEVNEKY